MGTLPEGNVFPTYTNLQTVSSNYDITKVGNRSSSSKSYVSDSEENTLDDENGEATPKVRFRNPGRQVGTAYFDYTAKEKDEISLTRGSMVEIISTDCEEEGWMIARVDNRKGMVPRNYVALVGEQPTVVSATHIHCSNYCIGSGGFADVYRGVFKQKPVALKIPRQTSTNITSKIREALEREALVLCRLNHTNVIGFLGISLKPMLLVLELCEGGTLFSLCRRMRVAYMPTSVLWAKQVASAMHHLHTREDPLVHADLKADNVLIKERPCACGVVGSSWRFSLHQYDSAGICRKCGGFRLDCLTMKITDFGLSRSMNTRRISLSGSVSWLAPEVIERKVYSIQSDIWSYGVFMWEIFSCKIPFNNYDHNVIMFAIVRGGKTLPLPDDCPNKLSAIFHACWNRDALKRPKFLRIVKMLEDYEEDIETGFKWDVGDYDESGLKPPSEETLSFGEIQRQFRDGKLRDFLWTAKQSITPFRQVGPPAPAVKPRKNRKPRTRVGKVDIGRPSDFRHHLSVRPSAEDLPSLNNPQGSMFVIKYGDEDEKIEEADELSDSSDNNDCFEMQRNWQDGNEEHVMSTSVSDTKILDTGKPKTSVSATVKNSLANITNTGYTHLPPLEAENENFVLVEFQNNAKSRNHSTESRLHTFEKKPAKSTGGNIHRNNYIRLADHSAANNVSNRRNCVSPSPMELRGGGHDGGGRLTSTTSPANIATLADVYSKLKSKSNPELANYGVLSNSTSDSERDEYTALNFADPKDDSEASTSFISAHRLNRKADYVTLKIGKDRRRSHENNFEHELETSNDNCKYNENACNSVPRNFEEFRKSDEKFEINRIKPKSDTNADLSKSLPYVVLGDSKSANSSLAETPDDDAKLNDSMVDSVKVRSLGRANAFRRKIMNSGGASSVSSRGSTNSTTTTPTTTPKPSLTSAEMPLTLLACDSQQRESADSSAYSYEFLGNEPKESSISLPSMAGAAGPDFAATGLATNSTPSLEITTDNEKDNQNLDPWMVSTPSDVSLLFDQSPTYNHDIPTTPSTSSSCYYSGANFPASVSSAATTTRTKSPSPLGARRRKASSSANSQSVFYVHDCEQSDSCVSDLDSFTDTTVSTPRRRANNNKLGHIFSKVSNIFGRSTPTDGIGGDLAAASGIADSSETREEDELVVEPVVCYHPNHFLNARHNCVLNVQQGTDYQLSPTLDVPNVDFIVQKTRTSNSSLSGTNLRPFTKLHDYPERQRQRQRTGSAAAAAAAAALANTVITTSAASGGAALSSSPSQRHWQNSVLLASPCEVRSFPPPAQTLNWRANQGGIIIGARSPPGGRSPAVTPSPSTAHPRISFDTVIELHSPNKAHPGTSQLRPHSHISGANSTHRRNDILSRPIQSVNDLFVAKQQNMPKHSTSRQQHPSPSRPELAMTMTPNSLYGDAVDQPTCSSSLFLNVSDPNGVAHQRSKSTDTKSTIGVDMSSLSSINEDVGGYGFHSLQRRKIHKRPELLGMQIGTNNNSGHTGTESAERLFAERLAQRTSPRALINRSYIPMSNSNREICLQDEQREAGGRGREDSDKTREERNSRQDKQFANIKHKIFVLGNSLVKDGALEATGNSKINDAWLCDEFGDASDLDSIAKADVRVPPIPLKKPKQKSSHCESVAEAQSLRISDLRMPTSTAPVFKMETPTISSYNSQVDEPENFVQKQRPSTLDLSRLRQSPAGINNPLRSAADHKHPEKLYGLRLINHQTALPSSEMLPPALPLSKLPPKSEEHDASYDGVSKFYVDKQHGIIGDYNNTINNKLANDNSFDFVPDDNEGDLLNTSTSSSGAWNTAQDSIPRGFIVIPESLSQKPRFQSEARLPTGKFPPEDSVFYRQLAEDEEEERAQKQQQQHRHQAGTVLATKSQPAWLDSYDNDERIVETNKIPKIPQNFNRHAYKK